MTLIRDRHAPPWSQCSSLGETLVKMEQEGKSQTEEFKQMTEIFIRIYGREKLKELYLKAKEKKE